MMKLATLAILLGLGLGGCGTEEPFVPGLPPTVSLAPDAGDGDVDADPVSIPCGYLAQNCPDGMGCYVTADAATCAVAGDALPGQACLYINDCTPGAGCHVDREGVGECAAYCNVSAYPLAWDPDHCPEDTICRPTPELDGVGLCR